MQRVAAELDQMDEPVVVVLDDYHVIHNPVCHASVEALTAHPVIDAPLAVSTRADPPVPLGRLRASGELVEIRGSDLAFTAAEAEEVLNGPMGLRLSAREVDILDECTEGWPAGLQLAALGLQACADRQEFLSSFGGSNRHIVDYLSEVVLDSLDEDTRRFLLQTSILSELSGPLCDAVTGRGDVSHAARLPAAVQYVRVPLDDQRQWYRYHHLFGELLRDQLTLTMPGQPPGCTRRHQPGSPKPDAATRRSGTRSRRTISRPRPTWWSAAGWPGCLPAGSRPSWAGLRSFRTATSRTAHRCRSSVPGRTGCWATTTRRARRSATRSPPARPGRCRRLAQRRARRRAVPLVLLPQDLVDEMREAARVVREFRSELRPEFQSVAALCLGVASFFGGDGEEARTHLDEAIRLASALGIWVVMVDALGLRIQVALMQNRTEDAGTLASVPA